MQQLTVEMLKQAGAFAPAKPERREIKWINDSKEIIEAVIHVRKSSFITMIEESRSVADSSYLMATRIASSVVDEQGKPVFTVDDLLGNEERGPICQSLAIALLSAIYDVNGVGKSRPKAIEPADEFWHELVLAGIGGKTVEEAKNTLTYREVIDWQSYRLKHGPLTVQRRVTDAADSIIALTAAIKRLNVEPEKLRVYQSANEEPEEQNIEAAFATLFAIANNNKAQK